MSDMLCVPSSDAYAHSKRAVDLVSCEINSQMNHKVCHVTSHVTVT